MYEDQKEFNRFKKVTAFVAKKFPCFGPNKTQEIERLFYEISKRENLNPTKIIHGAQTGGFEAIKEYLIRRRFPGIRGPVAGVYLPRLELSAESTFNPDKAEFSPKKIFVEQAVKGAYLVQRFQDAFPKAAVCDMLTLKDYLRQRKKRAIADYNARRDTVFITEQKDDFFKKCPCTKGAVGCGYHIFNLGFGCIFDCAYCYLQEYTNVPGIILPANPDKFFRDFSRYKYRDRRLGSGEFSDSLALDHITGYSQEIIDFFKKEPRATFEFKTKSDNIANLLKAKHCGNIVVSWSLNPQKIIEENEFFTASLSARLAAAKKCAAAEYELGFHFDPVFYFKNWQKEYGEVIEKLFASVKPGDVAWISIGTFRFKPGLKKIIEARFPANKILDEELLIGYDGKLRYPDKLRYDIYKFLIRTIKKYAKSLPIYLCMEEKEIWQKLRPRLPFIFCR